MALKDQENHPRKAECHACPARMEMRHELDMVREENARLKAEISRLKRTAGEKPFGSSTPSSEQLVKPNSPSEKSERKGGAKPGLP